MWSTASGEEGGYIPLIHSRQESLTMPANPNLLSPNFLFLYSFPGSSPYFLPYLVYSGRKMNEGILRLIYRRFGRFRFDLGKKEKVNLLVSEHEKVHFCCYLQHQHTMGDVLCTDIYRLKTNSTDEKVS